MSISSTLYEVWSVSVTICKIVLLMNVIRRLLLIYVGGFVGEDGIRLFRRVSEITKSDYNFVMSVRLSVCVLLFFFPHWTTRLPLERFSWILIFQWIPQSCKENAVYFFEFFLEWEKFSDKNCRGNKKLHFIFVFENRDLYWVSLSP